MQGFSFCAKCSFLRNFSIGANMRKSGSYKLIASVLKVSIKFYKHRLNLFVHIFSLTDGHFIFFLSKMSVKSLKDVVQVSCFWEAPRSYISPFRVQ